MGITIISNYEMPSNCYMCDLQNYHECDLTGESIEEDYCWNGDSREKHCPLREVEAIPKADYENRLKANMVAILTYLQLKIQNESNKILYDEENTVQFKLGQGNAYDMCKYLIQERINTLKADRSEEDAD